MTTARLQWSSAIAPTQPPVPHPWHWLAGTALATAILTGVSLRYAASEPVAGLAEEERVIVSLGGAPQRLEAPPPEVQTSEEAPIVAERAEDAPPPAAPAEQRVVAGSSDSDGRASSGTGAGTGPAPGPPAPPVAAPPPPPPPPTRVTQRFRDISIQQYNSLIVYPVTSLDREEQGRGVLRVTIERSGRVINWQLVRSTGHSRLDREISRVAGLVTRLDPLPSNFALDQVSIDIPVTFVIEYFD